MHTYSSPFIQNSLLWPTCLQQTHSPATYPFTCNITAHLQCIHSALTSYIPTHPQHTHSPAAHTFHSNIIAHSQHNCSPTTHLLTCNIPIHPQHTHLSTTYPLVCYVPTHSYSPATCTFHCNIPTHPQHTHSHTMYPLIHMQHIHSIATYALTRNMPIRPQQPCLATSPLTQNRGSKTRFVLWAQSRDYVCAANKGPGPVLLSNTAMQTPPPAVWRTGHSDANQYGHPLHWTPPCRYRPIAAKQTGIIQMCWTVSNMVLNV